MLCCGGVHQCTMKRSDPIQDIWEAALTVLLWFGVAGLFIAAPVYFEASQEAAAYNRFTTGPKATWWDALFVELRVEAK